MNESRLADYLEQVERAALDACSYVEGYDRDDFMSDKRTQHAVLMNIIIIGEAATKVSDRYPDFVRRNPQIRWQSMRGMRNRMAHGYAEINLDTVWRTLQDALPELLRALPELRRAAGREVEG